MIAEELDRLRVVLVSPRNPLNIGAAARAMSNFGVFHLRVVNPYAVAFREARSAVGAGAVVRSAEEYQTVAEAVADCALVVGTTAVGHRQLQHPLRRLEYGGRLMRRQLAGERVGLLFGSEKFGLSNDDLSHCHWLLRIPTREEHGSMNLGQAVAVCLYELVRNLRAAVREPEKARPAAAGELERFTQMLLDALRRSGYVNPRTAGSTETKVRRLVRRLNLPARDSEVWLGMLRQILWKLDRERGCYAGTEMTKVEVRYELARPLDAVLLDQIRAAHRVYGILRIAPSPEMGGLVVEYDASRLTEADVDAALRRAGVPVVRRA